MELKEELIREVRKKLPLNQKANDYKLLKIVLISLEKSNNNNFQPKMEIIVWRPGSYTLVAYRLVLKDESQHKNGFLGDLISHKKDDFSIPYQISVNHRSDWKEFRCLGCSPKNNYTILSSEIIEAKRIGSDENGFYYSLHS